MTPITGTESQIVMAHLIHAHRTILATMKQRRGRALDVIAALNNGSVPEILEPKLELEEILTRCAQEAAAWSAWQGSDGISSLRVLECDAEHARICGRVWEISKQTIHTFFFDVARRGSREDWTLYFDIDATSTTERRARQAADLITDPSDFTWVVVRSGSIETPPT